MNKKVNFALVLSCIAILLCLLVFALWTFEVIPHSEITSETFIGACITLLSIIVTIAIGWQIFNAVEVKSMIKEYAQKQEEVNILQQHLKDEIRRLEIESEYTKHHSMHLHAIALALHSELKEKYDEACYHCMEALAESMQMREEINEDEIIMMLDVYVNNIRGKITLSPSYSRELKEMDKIIRNSNRFYKFEEKYEEASSKYLKKIVVK